MQKPIIFLDFDGVVNTAIARDFCGNIDESLNSVLRNKYAISLLNILYEIVPFDIVISSAWRCFDDCDEILYQSGLSRDIQIIGSTHVSVVSEDIRRGFEIYAWIKRNNFKGNFIILDDKTNMGELLDWLIHCDRAIGFDMNDFEKARDLLLNGKNIGDVNLLKFLKYK